MAVATLIRQGMLTAVVAIPVRNEEARIGACLQALAEQVNVDPGTFGVLLLLNNCTDDTAGAVAAQRVPFPIKVIERVHPQASAGWARRAAMQEAAAWLRSVSMQRRRPHDDRRR